MKVGLSHSLLSLRKKMHQWFWLSNHAVKIAVLVKAFPDSRTERILLEVWQEWQPPRRPRQGATNTRQSAANMRVPAVIQTMLIVWSLCSPYEQATAAEKTNERNFHVTREPLSFSF